MRKCLRCDTEMVEDLDVKVEGGALLFVQSVVILKFTFKIFLKLKN